MGSQRTGTRHVGPGEGGAVALEKEKMTPQE